MGVGVRVSHLLLLKLIAILRAEPLLLDLVRVRVRVRARARVRLRLRLRVSGGG